jgi:hypothetical protein
MFISRSMRLNRALNVWNVEVSVEQQGRRRCCADPLVLLVEEFSEHDRPAGDRRRRSKGATVFTI